MLTEWHLPPDYIVNNWTDELFGLMVEKLVERKKRELEVINSKASPKSIQPVPIETLARASHGAIKILKAK